MGLGLLRRAGRVRRRLRRPARRRGGPAAAAPRLLARRPGAGPRTAGRSSQRSAPSADGVRAVRPVALDRFGLRLRLVGEDGRVLDARFEFGRPVRSAEDLPEAMRRLFAHATADR
ncbi:hypothetical protein ACFQ1I_11850 [Kitasatospora arboriphila]